MCTWDKKGYSGGSKQYPLELFRLFVPPKTALSPKPGRRTTTPNKRRRSRAGPQTEEMKARARLEERLKHMEKVYIHLFQWLIISVWLVCFCGASVSVTDNYNNFVIYNFCVCIFQANNAQYVVRAGQMNWCILQNDYYNQRMKLVTVEDTGAIRTEIVPYESITAVVQATPPGRCAVSRKTLIWQTAKTWC